MLSGLWASRGPSPLVMQILVKRELGSPAVHYRVLAMQREKRPVISGRMRRQHALLPRALQNIPDLRGLCQSPKHWFKPTGTLLTVGLLKHMEALTNTFCSLQATGSRGQKPPVNT